MHFSLLELIHSFGNSVLIFAIALGPALFALVAVISIPLLYIPLMTVSHAVEIFTVQTLILTIPVWILRKRLHPSDIIIWTRALPIPWYIQWLANMAMAFMVLLPIAITYCISVCIWLYQWPDWLQSIWKQGIYIVFISFIGTWIFCSLILICHSSSLSLKFPLYKYSYFFKSSAAPKIFIRRPSKPLLFFLWFRLFWLPFWREENGVGIRQSLLWLMAVCTALLWMWPILLFKIPRPAFAFVFNLMLILLTDRGDKAVTEQINLLRPIMAAWPMRTRYIEFCAKIFTLLPAIVVLLVLLLSLNFTHEIFSHKVAIIYFEISCLAHIALVSLALRERGRVVLVTLSILVLSAIGGELWR